jgi:hypothetical protein
LQELEQAGSAVLGLTFGILQGAIPFAGFVPSNNPDNAAYESARAVGNIIGGVISISYGLGATATGGGAAPGLAAAVKGGAAILNGYRALSMAGAVAVAGSGVGAAAGALSGAHNALNNGKPQPLQMSGEKAGGGEEAIERVVAASGKSLRKAVPIINQEGLSQSQAIEAITRVTKASGRNVGAVVQVGDARVMAGVRPGSNQDIVHISASGTATFGSATVHIGINTAGEVVTAVTNIVLP